MRESDYENVRKIYVKLYGSEDWMIKREQRWEEKIPEENEKDRKLFYALAEPEKFPDDLYACADYDREKFQNLPHKLSDAIKLLENGATNDYVFKHTDEWGYSYSWTPLDVATARGFDEITELILQKYPEELNKKDEYLHSPLYFGLLFEHEKKWKELVNCGSDNVVISWLFGNVHQNYGQEVWDYLKNKYESIEKLKKEIEVCFRLIRDRSLIAYWATNGIKTALKYITEDFGSRFVEKIFDWNGKENPIFYPIKRANRKPIFLGSFLKEIEMNGKIDLDASSYSYGEEDSFSEEGAETEEFGFISASNTSENTFTIIISDKSKFPIHASTGKFALNRKNNTITVS